MNDDEIITHLKQYLDTHSFYELMELLYTLTSEKEEWILDLEDWGISLYG
jgi:anti-anti-sigma regulatory factor